MIVTIHLIDSRGKKSTNNFEHLEKKYLDDTPLILPNIIFTLFVFCFSPEVRYPYCGPIKFKFSLIKNEKLFTIPPRPLLITIIYALLLVNKYSKTCTHKMKSQRKAINWSLTNLDIVDQIRSQMKSRWILLQGQSSEFIKLSSSNNKYVVNLALTSIQEASLNMIARFENCRNRKRFKPSTRLKQRKQMLLKLYIYM